MAGIVAGLTAIGVVVVFGAVVVVTMMCATGAWTLPWRRGKNG